MQVFEQIEQARPVTETMKDILQGALLAVYVHGSAASSGLRPQSDVDFLAVVDRPMTEDQRKLLLAALLRRSARYPAPASDPRCLEVMVFLQADIVVPRFPVRREFIYGEWLRDAIEAGDLPGPVFDPDNTLVLAQARQQAIPVFGPAARELLPEIAPEQVRRAMRDALPALLDDVRGDERNVLLTLARMWRTAATGEFISKDAAATWAAHQMPDHESETLIQARDAYLGRIDDDWTDRPAAVQQTAAHLHQRVSELV